MMLERLQLGATKKGEIFYKCVCVTHTHKYATLPYFFENDAICGSKVKQVGRIWKKLVFCNPSF
jgi:hypothetical protein